MSMAKAAAWWHENGIWIQGTPAEYFSDGARVISLVGGGGKTSLMYYLASVFQSRGYKTAAITTTRIARPEVLCETFTECQACWDAGKYAVCGQFAADGKLMAPAPAFLERLLNEADVILNEADGAKRRPCKVPADHEPVLLPESDTVIAVMGLDALGAPVEEMCFRLEQMCALLDCDLHHQLAEEDMVRILLSPHGSRKNVGDREYYIVLNKCDDKLRLERGKKIVALLEAQGHTKTVLTRLQ